MTSAEARKAVQAVYRNARCQWSTRRRVYVVTVWLVTLPSKPKGRVETTRIELGEDVSAHKAWQAAALNVSAA